MRHSRRSEGGAAYFRSAQHPCKRDLRSREPLFLFEKIKVSSSLESGTMVFPGPRNVPDILNAANAKPILPIEASRKRRGCQNPEMARGQPCNDRLALGAKNIVVDHHRAEQRKRHDMFDDVYIEAVDAQMQNLSRFLEPAQGIQQIVAQVGNFRSVKLQQRDGVQSKPDQARLDGSLHAKRRKVLAPPAPLIRVCSGFGRNYQIMLVFEAGNRPAQSRFGISAGIACAGIEERNALIDRRMNQTDRSSFVEDFLAPITRAAESDFGDPQAGISQRTIEHPRIAGLDSEASCGTATCPGCEARKMAHRSLPF